MYCESKINKSINNFKNVNLPLLRGIRFNIFPFAQPIRHLGISILDGNLYLGPLEIILRTLASGMAFRLPVITCPAEGYK